MARLPSNEWLIQMIDDDLVILFHEFTEEEIVRLDPSDPNSFGPGIQKITQSDKLTLEDKSMAAFWVGYFYAHTVRDLPYSPDAN